MKKLLVLFAIVTMILTIGLLTGCQSKYYTYSDANDYTLGGGSAAGINTIDIDWYYGKVDVVYGEVTKVTFSEVTDLDEDYQMRYLVKDNKLLIKSFKSGKIVKSNQWQKDKKVKNLTVTMPVSYELEGLDIDLVSADFNMVGANAKGIKVHSISGDINISDLKAEVGEFGSTSGDWVMNNIDVPTVSFETVSGDAKITGLKANTADIESTSGNWTMENCVLSNVEFDTVSGNVVLSGGSANKVDIKTTSGDINLACTGTVSDAKIQTNSGEMAVLNYVPDKLDVKSTSGDLTLYFDGEPSFKVKFSTTSGDLKNNFAGTNVDGYYVVGAGDKVIDVKSVSGDLKIKRPDSDVITAA